MKTEFYKMEYEAWDEGTDDLSLEQEAAYLRLCHQMYRRRGPIPNSLNMLFRIWRCHPNKAKSILGHLVDAGKITITPEGYLTQSRVSRELVDRELRSSRAADAGQLGGSRRAVNAANQLKSKETGQADASSQPKPSQAIRGDKSRGEEIREDGPAMPEVLLSDLDFDQWYQRYPHKVGKQAAKKAFDGIRSKRLVTQADIMAGLNRYIADKPADRAWCNPATWLNDHRWADQPAEVSPSRPAPGSVVAFKAKPPPRVALEVAAVSDQEWTRRLNGWRHRREWDLDVWGPTPEQRGCASPPHLLAEAGVKPRPIMMNLGNGKPVEFDTSPLPRAAPDLLDEDFTGATP